MAALEAGDRQKGDEYFHDTIQYQHDAYGGCDSDVKDALSEWFDKLEALY